VTGQQYVPTILTLGKMMLELTELDGGWTTEQVWIL
jgi:hypothetical protein